MISPFVLHQPRSLPEALSVLSEHNGDSNVLAGGSELLLLLKMNLIRAKHIVDIKKIPGLHRLDLDPQGTTLHVGPLVTHRTLETSELIKRHFPLLAEMERDLANVRIRNVGTLAGNLCFAEPHADPGTLLMALGAKLIAEKGSSKRQIEAEDFFVDAYETALQDDELLTAIHVPVPGAHARSAYLKFGYLERPSVGLAIALSLTGAMVGDVKIAVGCAGPAPKRVAEAEALLSGKSKEEAARNLAQAGIIAGKASQAISDLHGAQDYKEHIVGVLLKRAFQSAIS
jgi:carbon-monoxide dehydrogenase medium subunit